jgi:hypothetical protein
MLRRMLFVIAILTAPVIGACASQAVPEHPRQQVKSSVVYPDVWDREVPEFSGKRSVLNAYYSADGDVYLIYHVSMDDPRSLSSPYTIHALKFFSGERQVITDQSFYRSHERAWAGARITFASTGVVLESYEGPGGQHCYRGLRSSLRLYHNGELERTLKLLYVPQEPALYVDTYGCPDDREFREKVFAMAPLFIVLKDGTFLAADSKSGRVVRFNQDLSSRSQLMNNDIFLIKAGLIEELRLETEHGWTSEVQDLLYGQLMSRREGKR